MALLFGDTEPHRKWSPLWRVPNEDVLNRRVTLICSVFTTIPSVAYSAPDCTLGPLSPGSFRAGFRGGSHRSLQPGAGGALTQSKFLQELDPLHCAPGSDQSASLWRSVGKFCLASQRKKEQHKTNRWYDMKGLRWSRLLEGHLNFSSKGKLKTTAGERSPASQSPDTSVKIYRMTLLWQKWMTLPC